MECCSSLAAVSSKPRSMKSYCRWAAWRNRDEVEHYGQGGLVVQGQFLGLEQGPVILGPLSRGEPVNNRAALVGVVV